MLWYVMQCLMTHKSRQTHTRACLASSTHSPTYPLSVLLPAVTPSKYLSTCLSTYLSTHLHIHLTIYVYIQVTGGGYAAWNTTDGLTSPTKTANNGLFYDPSMGFTGFSEQYVPESYTYVMGVLGVICCIYVFSIPDSKMHIRDRHEYTRWLVLLDALDWMHWMLVRVFILFRCQSISIGYTYTHTQCLHQPD